MDEKKIFLVDRDKEFLYVELFQYLNKINCLPRYIYSKDINTIFYNIVGSLIYDIPIVLLDSDFSHNEIQNLGISLTKIDENIELKNKILVNYENFLSLLQNTKEWNITLFTSGTTGLPKKVSHSFETLTRMVKINISTKDNIWGFAYNPSHIAGLQVFFQAILNLNTIVNLFEQSRSHIFDMIEKYSVTNISATPTFFRLLLPSKKHFNSVVKITSGGEKFDTTLINHLRTTFPQAKLLNVYASTEAGTIFGSKNDVFEIREDIKDKVKIINNELLIHKELLGHSDSLKVVDGWYFTGDIVEVISNNPLKFKFVSRKNEMINVGGYKVNPIEIEELLNKHPNIVMSRVYSKKNSVLGNILLADIQRVNDITEKDIQMYLRKYLQEFKIPRIINFVEKIELTRTGKIKRA